WTLCHRCICVNGMQVGGSLRGSFRRISWNLGLSRRGSNSHPKAETLLGVGIDEGTAMVVSQAEFEVLGRGTVVVGVGGKVVNQNNGRTAPTSMALPLT